MELFHHFNTVQPHIGDNYEHGVLVLLLQLLQLGGRLHRSCGWAAEEVHVAVVRPGNTARSLNRDSAGGRARADRKCVNQWALEPLVCWLQRLEVKSISQTAHDDPSSLAKLNSEALFTLSSFTDYSPCG